MRVHPGRGPSFALVSAFVVGFTLCATADGPDRYSAWATPVRLDAPLNTDSADFYPFVSKNGLSLYFSSDRAGGLGGWDVWVCQRSSIDEPWGAPANLGPGVNTPYDDGAPTLSVDGHRMYFQSNRPGGFGNGDLYVSRRHNKRDDLAWQVPENLGSGVNSPYDEAAPTTFEDDSKGAVVLYFATDRPGGPGPAGPGGPGVNGQQGTDIYGSVLQADETFGPAMLVPEINTLFFERRPLVRHDGLELFLTSNRPGGFGLLDIWVSRRHATSEPWEAPVNLGATVNSAGPDAGAAIDFDQTTLYFQSVRPWPSTALYDLWMTTRDKLKKSSTGTCLRTTPPAAGSRPNCLATINIADATAISATNDTGHVRYKGRSEQAAIDQLDRDVLGSSSSGGILLTPSSRRNGPPSRSAKRSAP